VNVQLELHRPAQRFGLLSIYGLLAALALLVARFIPVAKIFSPWWGCPLRRATGIPCFGCGLTRAFDWEAHGHVLRAFALTPVGALLPLCFAVIAGWGLLVLVARVPVPEIRLDAAAGRVLRWSLIGAVLANWIYMVLTRKGA
jgi:hypothetical protein